MGPVEPQNRHSGPTPSADVRPPQRAPLLARHHEIGARASRFSECRKTADIAGQHASKMGRWKKRSEQEQLNKAKPRKRSLRRYLFSRSKQQMLLPPGEGFCFCLCAVRDVQTMMLHDLPHATIWGPHNFILSPSQGFLGGFS